MRRQMGITVAYHTASVAIPKHQSPNINQRRLDYVQAMWGLENGDKDRKFNLGVIPALTTLAGRDKVIPLLRLRRNSH